MKKKNEFPKYFLIDHEYTSDRHNIPMTFNEYYANIGSKLASSIRIPDGVNFKNYLNTPLEQCFEFQKVDRVKVLKDIQTLKTRDR